MEDLTMSGERIWRRRVIRHISSETSDDILKERLPSVGKVSQWDGEVKPTIPKDEGDSFSAEIFELKETEMPLLSEQKHL